MVALTTTRTMIIARARRAQRLQAGLHRRGVGAVIIADAAELVALRRDLLVHRGSVVICIELHDATLANFGRSLLLLLADRRGFAADVRVVGIMRGALGSQFVALGCDGYARSSRDVVQWCDAFDEQMKRRPMARLFNGSMNRARNRQVNDEFSGRSTARHLEPASVGLYAACPCSRPADDRDTRCRLTEEQSAVFPRA